MEKQVGLGAGEIERLVAIIPDLGKLNEAVLVVTTRKPLDRSKVLGKLVPGGGVVWVGKRSYVAGDKKGLAAHIENRHTLLVGEVPAVRAFLSRKPAKADALASTLTAAARKPLLAVGARPGAFAPVVEKAGKDGKPYLPLFKALAWQITADGSDGLAFHFRLTFPDEAAAKQAGPALEAALKQFDAYLQICHREFQPFFKREAERYKQVGDLKEPLLGTIEATRAALKTFKALHKGKEVRGTLRVQTKTPATALVLLVSLAPRGAKEEPDKKEAPKKQAP
jgi:hypothetical protein